MKIMKKIFFAKKKFWGCNSLKRCLKSTEMKLSQYIQRIYHLQWSHFIHIYGMHIIVAHYSPVFSCRGEILIFNSFIVPGNCIC